MNLKNQTSLKFWDSSIKNDRSAKNFFLGAFLDLKNLQLTTTLDQAWLVFHLINITWKPKFLCRLNLIQANLPRSQNSQNSSQPKIAILTLWWERHYELLMNLRQTWNAKEVSNYFYKLCWAKWLLRNGDSPYLIQKGKTIRSQGWLSIELFDI